MQPHQHPVARGRAPVVHAVGGHQPGPAGQPRQRRARQFEVQGRAAVGGSDQHPPRGRAERPPQPHRGDRHRPGGTGEQLLAVAPPVPGEETRDGARQTDQHQRGERGWHRSRLAEHELAPAVAHQPGLDAGAQLVGGSPGQAGARHRPAPGALVLGHLGGVAVEVAGDDHQHRAAGVPIATAGAHPAADPHDEAEAHHEQDGQQELGPSGAGGHDPARPPGRVLGRRRTGGAGVPPIGKRPGLTGLLTGHGRRPSRSRQRRGGPCAGVGADGRRRRRRARPAPPGRRPRRGWRRR